MHTSTTRVETYSNRVMAIMIVELKLTDFDESHEMDDIRNNLQDKELIQHFAAYAFSFVMFSILWTSHQHLFHLLKKTDNVLAHINLFPLFWITHIPIVTDIFGANPLLPISTSLWLRYATDNNSIGINAKLHAKERLNSYRY